MALLHSLEISGVRNFSPENTQCISFNTPVTLLLGQNGCGKTTIIESIRFALTGELPSGSSKGQGFLNDPKMSSKYKVEASIKMKYFDIQGNMITVCKVMSVTVKIDGLTFNQTSTMQKMDKNNQECKGISGKCVDIDNYCSSALNISKSILNNVLFCHQENSSWPLDEPKKVKEKFDEIFDADTYKKCVDSIRSYIKNKLNDMKLLEKQLETKETIKLEVERQRRKLTTKTEELKEVFTRINEKKALVRHLEDRMDEILTLTHILDELQRELHANQAEKKGLRDQQETIIKYTAYIFEGTDEELENRIKTFKSEQSNENKAILDLEQKKKQVYDTISGINRNIQNAQVKIGNLKGEQNQNTKKIYENIELVETLRLQLDMGEFPKNTNAGFKLKSFKTAISNYKVKYNSLVKQMNIQESELQQQIDKTRDQFAASKERLLTKSKQSNEIKTKLNEIKNKLQELDCSNSQLKDVDQAIEDERSTLTKLKQSFDENQKQEKIEDQKEIIFKKEQDFEKLDQEHRILQQNYAKEQQIDTERNTIFEKEKEINRIKSKHYEKFKRLFGEDFPEKNTKSSILQIQHEEELKVKGITQKINRIEKELTTLETTINHIKKKVDNDKKELAMKKRKVEIECGGKQFIQVLQDTCKTKEKLQKDKGQYSSAKIMYEHFISKFEDEAPCCPICDTDFRNKTNVIKEVIKKLKGKIEYLPTLLVQVENELKKEENSFNKLQQLKTVNDDVELLEKTKIPALEEDLATLNEEFEEKQMTLAEEKANLVAPQDLFDIARNVVADAALLDQYHSDINKSKTNISHLEQTIHRVASNRSRQEAEAEIDISKADLSNLKNRLESCKKMLDLHKDRCHKLNESIQNLIQKQINIQKLVQEKPLLDKQQEEYNEILVSLTQDIYELNETLVTQDKELKNLIAEKQQLTERNGIAKEKERLEINKQTNMLEKIQKLQREIDHYVNNNIDGELDKTLNKLAELQLNVDKAEQSKIKITDSITEKKELVAKQETEFRALNDNVTLREKHKAEEILTSVITKLEQDIGKYNYRSVHEEKRRIESQIGEYTREMSSLKGQKEEIQKQVNDLRIELDKPQNRSAYNNYKKQFYELRLEELLVKDFQEYINVLEKSVLKFHEERMVQINRTIRELWRSIYRGNDIDYIEIKTDEHKVSGTNRRRTYNYKVVQVKNNVELEMRGRCSAGQKVLACLVIRMALAETFSSHCGILALDEPTTNLDRENIQSLSGALSRIIDDRANQRNFQLLIITHDEDFLNNIITGQSVDNYWKVKRNQSGFSIIEKNYL